MAAITSWEIDKISAIQYVFRVNGINIVLALNEQKFKNTQDMLLDMDFQIETYQDKEANIYVIGFID